MNLHRQFELAVPVSADEHSLGPTDATVTLVEYGDFECPNCKQAAPVVKLLLQRFSGRLRFVYRHFPLEEVHPHALHAALAAEAAGRQGKFWPMHDLLFDNQPRLDLQYLREYAAKLGLDLARFDMAFADYAHMRRIRAHIEGGRQSGVRATPTFFLDRMIQDVSFGVHTLSDAIEARLLS
jgi:protein-disulfide isomerase